MILTLLNLIQTQPPKKISWYVWAAAIVVFLAGLSLLVYFFKRLSKTDVEGEEDWNLSQRSIFAETAPAISRDRQQADAAQLTAEEVAPPPKQSEPKQSEPRQVEPPSRDETRPLVSEAIETPQPKIEPRRVETQPIETQPIEAQPKPARPPIPRPREERATEVLTSARPDTPVVKPDPESTPFDDEVWAELESVKPEQMPTPPASEIEEAAHSREARAEQRPPRARFEPPRIESVSQREPFVPPIVEPLAPRAQQGTARPTQPLSRYTDTQFQPRERENRPVVAPSRPTTEAAALTDSTLETGRRAEHRRDSRARSSVLGLPSEASEAPLILGEPARPANELGIGALSNYGKDIDKPSGHGGTIALVVTIVLVASAVLAYLYVPSINSRVNATVARIRGRDPNQSASQAVEKARARVFPSQNPEVVKNMVKARGAVDNISEEPLENLSVEVSLERGGEAPPEIRRVNVTPPQLAPRERGIFEFEYDGKRDTGFKGYRITKLFSNDSEVKFDTPIRQKS